MITHPRTRTALALGAAGAALMAGAALAQDAPITLEVWSWQVAFEDQYEELFALYEEANPGIEVDFRGFVDSEYPTILAAGLSDASGPDIAMLHPYRAIAPYALADQIVPIDRETVPELDNFTPEAIDAATLDGTIYGVPFAKQALQVFYNVGLFEELGIEPPATASEIEPMLAAIREAGIIPYAIAGAPGTTPIFYFDPLVGNVYGGRDFLEHAAAGEASFADESMVEAMRAFAGQEENFPPFVSGVGWADATALFAAGRAAMAPGGAWSLAGLREQAPDLDVGVFSLPADDAGGPPPTWGWEDGALALSAASEHPEEALALLRWMGTPEFGQAFSNTLFQMSSVKGVEPRDPVLAEIAANYEANPVPMVWVTEYFGTAAPAPFTTLGVSLQNLLLGETTPEEAAAALERDAREHEAAVQ